MFGKSCSAVKGFLALRVFCHREWRLEEDLIDTASRRPYDRVHAGHAPMSKRMRSAITKIDLHFIRHVLPLAVISIIRGVRLRAVQSMASTRAAATSTA